MTNTGGIDTPDWTATAPVGTGVILPQATINAAPGETVTFPVVYVGAGPSVLLTAGLGAAERVAFTYTWQDGPGTGANPVLQGAFQKATHPNTTLLTLRPAAAYLAVTAKNEGGGPVDVTVGVSYAGQGGGIDSAIVAGVQLTGSVAVPAGGQVALQPGQYYPGPATLSFYTNNAVALAVIQHMPAIDTNSMVLVSAAAGTGNAWTITLPPDDWQLVLQVPGSVGSQVTYGLTQ